VNSTVNYKTYLNSDRFVFKVSGVTREPVQRDVNVRAKLQFEIETKL
jgi:hypothetical protein